MSCKLILLFLLSTVLSKEIQINFIFPKLSIGLKQSHDLSLFLDREEKKLDADDWSGSEGLSNFLKHRKKAEEKVIEQEPACANKFFLTDLHEVKEVVKLVNDLKEDDLKYLNVYSKNEELKLEQANPNFKLIHGLETIQLKSNHVISKYGHQIALAIYNGKHKDKAFYHAAIFFIVAENKDSAIEALAKVPPESSFFRNALNLLCFIPFNDEATEQQMATLNNLPELIANEYSGLFNYFRYVSKASFNLGEAVKYNVFLDGNKEYHTLVYKIYCESIFLSQLMDGSTHLEELLMKQIHLKKMLLEERSDKKYVNENTSIKSFLVAVALIYGELPGMHCTTITLKKTEEVICQFTDFALFAEAYTKKANEYLKKIKNNSPDRSNVISYHKQRLATEMAGNEAKSEFLAQRKSYVGTLSNEAPEQPKYQRKFNPAPIKHDFVDFCRKYHYKNSLHSQPPPNPHLFIDLNSRGFRVHDLLNKYLELTPDQLTPLPWDEPLCESIPESVFNDSFLFKIPLVKENWNMPSIFNGDPYKHRIVEKLIQLIGQRRDQSFLIGDFGERINMLNRLNIGPKWLRTELSILYFRALGRFRNAFECIVQNLNVTDIDDTDHSDLTFVQLAAILWTTRPKDASEDAIAALEKALTNKRYEHPLTHYLYGISVSDAQERLTHLWRSFQLDPSFQPTIDELRYQVCERSFPSLPLRKSLIEKVCCWSTEQNVLCFGNPNLEKNCFKFVPGPLEDLNKWQLSSFRCSRTYSARSFRPPSVSIFFETFLYKIGNLRDKKIQSTIDDLSRRQQDQERMDRKVIPVMPLDHGGYSEEKLAKYQKYLKSDENLVSSYVNPAIKTGTLNQNDSKTHKTNVETVESASWADILSFDMNPPSVLPAPESNLRVKGEKLISSSNITPLDPSACTPGREALLLAPLSTDMFITAKGVKLTDFPQLTSTQEPLEPFCPLTSSTSIPLFDNMAAFKFQGKFKFYKPEKALKDPLLRITRGKDTVETFATRLSLAIKHSKSVSQDEQWKYSTIAALYWRVQGDAVNAVNCLKFALLKSPDSYRDVAAIGLANIYHQAGFLHSALHAADYALKNSATTEVSVHLTLANIYASLRNYDHALQFYHSTLALQPKFALAMERVRAIKCILKRSQP